MEAGTIPRKGQEGSRWVNERPTGEQVADWFKENVKLHDESLLHEDYVQGITLIQQTAEEKEVVGWKEDGAPVIDKRENLYYVPYAKVETRVKYFWDFIGCHPDWLGVIEPVAPPTPPGDMPEGFYRMVVRKNNNDVVAFVCCTMRATVYERDSVEMVPVVNRRTGDTRFERQGKVIMQSAPGSKMVPVMGRWGPDENSLMKVETGAVGRALGLLGMLIVPGSGVATAEDVQEALAAEGGASQAAPAPEAVKVEDDDAALKKRVTVLVGDLGNLDEARLEKFRAYVRDRGIAGVADATSPQLRGLITKLEAEIEEANAAAETKPETKAKKPAK